MAARRSGAKEHIHRHKDGSLWAKGKMVGGVPAGYWEWFRKDGSRMRSGSFEDGRQVGEWTTYDRQGRVFKVTTMKPKPAAASASGSKRKGGASGGRRVAGSSARPH